MSISLVSGLPTRMESEVEWCWNYFFSIKDAVKGDIEMKR